MKTSFPVSAVSLFSLMSLLLVWATVACQTTHHRSHADADAGGSGSGCLSDCASSGAGGSAGGSAGSAGALASGGSAGAGGAAGASGASSGTCPTDPNLITAPNGWIGCDPATATDNPLGIQGGLYMFSDGSSCTQVDNPCGTMGCCIDGSTAADATFAKWGCGLGLELNATGGVSSVKQAYSGALQCFDITLAGSSGGNNVRISYTQAAEMAGKVAPFIELDPIEGSWSGRVCLEDVSCPNWMPAPDCVKSAPFDLQIQIVGAVHAGDFNLCLTDLIPSDGTGTGLTVLKQLCDENAEATGGGYLFRNNVWNPAASGSQCLTAKQGGGIAAFTIDSSTLSISGDSPAAYPSIVKGWNWGQWTDQSGMPKAISALNTASSSVSFAVPSGGKWDAAYDIWVLPGVDGATPNGGLELMIWLASAGGPNPAGTPQGSAVIGGVTFNVYSGTLSDSGATWSYIAYWAQDGITTWSADLKPFLNDAVGRTPAESSWNLASIQFGFEIWQSQPGFAVNSFTATVD